MAQRSIKTEFYNHRGEVVRTTYADNPNGAAMRAFHGLLMGWDGAASVQVFEQSSAKIITEIVRKKNGKLETTLDYNPVEFAAAVRRRTLAAVFTPEERSVLAHIMNSGS